MGAYDEYLKKHMDAFQKNFKEYGDITIASVVTDAELKLEAAMDNLARAKAAAFYVKRQKEKVND